MYYSLKILMAPAYTCGKGYLCLLGYMYILPQDPFLASLWIGSGLGCPERNFGEVFELYHFGAHFEALDTLFMAPSDLIGILLHP